MIGGVPITEEQAIVSMLNLLSRSQLALILNCYTGFETNRLRIVRRTTERRMAQNRFRLQGSRSGPRLRPQGPQKRHKGPALRSTSPCNQVLPLREERIRGIYSGEVSMPKDRMA